MKKTTVHIPCVHCKREEDIAVSEKALQEWAKGKHVQDAFPELSAEEREMFISQTCPECWKRIFGDDGDYEEEPNPKIKDYLFDDAVRMAEFKFKKPYNKFGEKEIQYLHMLYNKADDDRLSLKLLPERDSDDEIPFMPGDPVELPERESGLIMINPKKKRKNPAIVKTKEDEAKWRRAIRSTERKFKKKEKDFKDREWRYTMGTFKKLAHI